MKHDFISADIDEKAIRKEKPEELIVALAEAKADAIMSKLQKIYTQEWADARDARQALAALLVISDTIHFHDIPEQVIESMIREGNVLNVARALIIEHPLIVPYVKEVVGETDSVMGIPVALTDKTDEGSVTTRYVIVLYNRIIS